MTVKDNSTIQALLNNYEVLQEVTRLLDKETPETKNWKDFAQRFGLTKAECDYLCPVEYHSSTTKLMEYLSCAKPKLTIHSFIDALRKIDRMDVVEESLKKFFNHIGKLAVFSSCCDKSGNNDILYLTGLRTRACASNLQVPYPRSNSGKRTFAYSAATLFNCLDTDLKQIACVSPSSIIFSSRLNNFKHKLFILFLSLLVTFLLLKN